MRNGGQKWRGEVVFLGLRALYLTAATRGGRCIALCFTSRCRFHFEIRMGSWWQEGEGTWLPRSPLNGTDPFCKRFIAMQYVDVLFWYQ